MNAELQSCFDRLDLALNALIDSLASYNPSPTAAAALVVADDELISGLDRLYLHQRNYRKIKSLRLSVNNLDDRVKSTLLRLVDMRKSLLDFDSASMADASSEVDQVVLLNYAQHISRFTVPPTYRPPLPPAITSNDTVKIQDISPSGPGMDSSGVTTQQTLTSHEANMESFGPTQASHFTEAEGKALEALPPAVKAWLEPPSLNMPFMPWPEEGRIRQGALGRIESTWYKGQDPRGQDLLEMAESGEPNTAE